MNYFRSSIENIGVAITSFGRKTKPTQRVSLTVIRTNNEIYEFGTDAIKQSNI